MYDLDDGSAYCENFYCQSFDELKKLDIGKASLKDKIYWFGRLE
jgi:hypothetical protein